MNNIVYLFIFIGIFVFFFTYKELYNDNNYQVFLSADILNTV